VFFCIRNKAGQELNQKTKPARRQNFFTQSGVKSEQLQVFTTIMSSRARSSITPTDGQYNVCESDLHQLGAEKGQIGRKQI